MGEKLWIIGLTTAVNLFWPVSNSGGMNANKIERMSVAVIRGVLAVAAGAGIKAMGGEGMGVAILIYGAVTASDGLVAGFREDYDY